MVGRVRTALMPSSEASVWRIMGLLMSGPARTGALEFIKGGLVLLHPAHHVWLVFFCGICEEESNICKVRYELAVLAHQD